MEMNMIDLHNAEKVYVVSCIAGAVDHACAGRAETAESISKIAEGLEPHSVLRLTLERVANQERAKARRILETWRSLQRELGL